MPKLTKVQRLEAFHWQNYMDPVGYCRAVLGVDLWYKQRQIFEAVRDHNFVSVASSNAAGKSFLASCLVPWFLQTRPLGYVVTTAATWKGLEKILWPEIHRRVNGARDKGLRRLGHLLKTEWNIAPQYGAFSLSPREPEGFGGFRTSYGVMVIVDEASNLPEDKHDAIMGLCSMSLVKVFYIGNPLRPSGPFYETFKSPSWKTFHISAFDVPNVIHGRDIIPGLATQQWVETRRNEWGENSPAFKARVMGEFPDGGEDALIPLYLVENAIQRGGDYEEDGANSDAPITLGVDVARFGDDATVIQAVQGKVAFEPQKYYKQNTMATVGHVVRAIKELNPSRVNVDDIGVGGGVTDRLVELGYGSIVHGINVADAPNDAERFLNRRAEAWWQVKEWLESGGMLPDDRGILGALTAPKYKFASNGTIRLEPKDETKKRLGRSPDEGDALMLALLNPYPEISLW